MLWWTACGGWHEAASGLALQFLDQPLIVVFGEVILSNDPDDFGTILIDHRQYPRSADIEGIHHFSQVGAGLDRFDIAMGQIIGDHQRVQFAASDDASNIQLRDYPLQAAIGIGDDQV